MKQAFIYPVLLPILLLFLPFAGPNSQGRDSGDPIPIPHLYGVDPTGAVVGAETPRTRPADLQAAFGTANSDSILDVHPLAIGMSRVYSVTVTYQKGTEEQRWQGTITETVTSDEPVEGGRLFTVEQEGDHPFWYGSSTRTLYFLAFEDRLYRLHAREEVEMVLQEEIDELVLYRWPMAVGDRWGAPEMVDQAEPLWTWQVKAQEDVETATEQYSGCYRLLYRTNPDHIVNWFCPGTGTVRHEYVHHGTVHEEQWELQQMIPAGRS